MLALNVDALESLGSGKVLADPDDLSIPHHYAAVLDDGARDRVDGATTQNNQFAQVPIRSA